MARWFLLVCLLGAPGRSAAQDLQVRKLWEKGEVDGPPETIWVRIRDATILNDRVFALDVGAPTVRAFTVSGDYVDDLGRKGSGPGEFVLPTSLSVVDDSLRVYDLGLKRYAVFDAEGRHGRTSSVADPLNRGGGVYWIERLWPGRHGWWMGLHTLLGTSRPSQSVSRYALLMWRSLEAVDTLISYDGNPTWTKYHRTDSLHLNTTLQGNLGSDGGVWVLGDSLVAWVDGATSTGRLYQVGRDSLMLVRTKTLPGDVRPLSEAENKDAIAWYYRRSNTEPGAEGAPIEVVPPDHWSAWTKVVGDEKGNIWMRQGGPRILDPAKGERWARWSLADDSLRWVELPPGVEGLRFREGYVVGMEHGEFGVQSLVLLELVGS